MREHKLICTDGRRREQVRVWSEHWNGLDYVEVSDANPLVLTVYFLNRAPTDISRENVVIEGGRRVTGIKVERVEVIPAKDKTQDDTMRVWVDKPGDSSTYTLRLVEEPWDAHGGSSHRHPLQGFDPCYASVAFSFRADPTSLLDCKRVPVCPPEQLAEPALDYLAKDYASFRQLIYDRLSLIMLDWRERHVPDIGVALVELLAYVGDYLSQYQDAVATEAYLSTARLRTSVRRHARLVDYRLHEGCNARVWVHVRTSVDFHEILEPGDLRFSTGRGIRRPDATLIPASTKQPVEIEQPVKSEEFEPLLASAAGVINLYAAHNEIHFYTWGDTQCCLPRGATSATLIDDRLYSEKSGKTDQGVDHDLSHHQESDESWSDYRRFLRLHEGDYLLLEEILGPRTGEPADADPAHRHIVRLTKVDKAYDALYDVALLEVAWANEDALPFPQCISTLDSPQHSCRKLENVSVARGNLLLADHGRTVEIEQLGTVPLVKTEQTCVDEEELSEIAHLPGAFEPALKEWPLAFAESLLPVRHPPVRTKAKLLEQDPREALPCINVWSIPPLPDASGPLFTSSDLDDPTDLIEKLRIPNHPRAVHLYAYLSRRTLWLLRSLDELTLPPHQGVVLREALYADIGRVRRGWEPEADIPLSKLWHTALRESLREDLRRLLRQWEPRFDLLDSRPNDRHFVAEIDNEGQARLRFGDGQMGRQPEPGEAFIARYRIGGGPAGNVGTGTISQASDLTLKPRNPFPAQGGTAPESLAEAKTNAAHVLHARLERAVTSEDYALIVMRDFKDEVQRAAATIDGQQQPPAAGTFNKGRHVVDIAVDPWHHKEASPVLLKRIEEHLCRYRRMGHQLNVKVATYVPLDIAFKVTVRPGYLRRRVEAELRDVFSNRRLPDGRKGIFHPDNLSFDDDICLSRLVAAAQAVPGVESVKVTTLKRHSAEPAGEIEAGVLVIKPWEIARLDNNSEFPENGVLTFEMAGGR